MMLTAEPKTAPPPDWDEALYLNQNPDVAKGVREGWLPSGYGHYMKYGRYENRPDGWRTDVNAPLTRNCIDPWTYLEFGVTGDIRPCCIHPPVDQIDTLSPNKTTFSRNQEKIRSLRRTLLDGQLVPHCQSCHIRPMVSTHQLHKRVEMLLYPDEELENPAPLQQCRVDLTSMCNLKCVYCAVSQPDYRGKHMPHQTFQAILDVIGSDNRQLEVHLNGHGETTCHPKWVEYALLIQSVCPKTEILSNFAKCFSAEEVDVLARMHVIQISLDTVDAPLLRTIRRHIALDTIVDNISSIRSRAAAINTHPTWSLSCGIYDINIDGLNDFAEFVIASHFETVTFWNPVAYPSVTDRRAPRPISILDLPPPARAAALQKARNAVSLLEAHNVIVEVAGDFLNPNH